MFEGLISRVRGRGGGNIFDGLLDCSVVFILLKGFYEVKKSVCLVVAS